MKVKAKARETGAIISPMAKPWDQEPTHDSTQPPERAASGTPSLTPHIITSSFEEIPDAARFTGPGEISLCIR